MKLLFLLCSVALASHVAGGSPHSALPRYSHLHRLQQQNPSATRPEPSSKESSINTIDLNTVGLGRERQRQRRVGLRGNSTATEVENLGDGKHAVGGIFTTLEERYEAYNQAGELEPKRKAVPNDIVFQLFTRKSGLTYERLEADNLSSILNSSFDPSKGTVAIIHGFVEDADISPWMKTMRDWFLDQEDVNVILVQWAKLADHLLNYYHVAKNARFVGAELGRLFTVIKKQQGLSADSVYIIGFSLGAHAAGIAGQNFPGVSRITGLDPAGPAFENKPINKRLDHTDAKFVDVIHTNYGPLVELHFGYKENLGHVDHYVNGGRLQPGCKPITTEAITKFFTGDLRDFHPCNHERSYLYYIESLRSTQPPASFKCSSYTTFKTGVCLRKDTNIFGFRVNPDKPGVYYLETQSAAPYLSRHLEVTITVGAMKKTTTGQLDLLAYPLDRVTDLQTLARAHNYRTGEKLRTLLVLPLQLPLSAVPLQLKFDKSEFHLMRPSTLNISSLQLVEVDKKPRYFQSCNTTLHSRVWSTVSPTLLQCEQPALL